MLLYITTMNDTVKDDKFLCVSVTVLVTSTGVEVSGTLGGLVAVLLSVVGVLVWRVSIFILQIIY